MYFSCDGASAFDKEQIGKISYYPSQEISGIYFPYTGHPDYLAPFIAIKIEKSSSNMVLELSCRLYGKNVNPEIDGTENSPSGILRFNVYMG